MTNFISRIDVGPTVWQFLQNLRADDLATELIQNELDANSTESRLTFAEERFVCEGNGEAIDADGWSRLSFIIGAGDQAPRKHNKTGVKNHGLKACFTLGNHIRIWSDGKRFEQTLLRNGESADPFPGTFAEPEDDKSAPSVGCRIVVPYRRKPLIVERSENVSFHAVDDSEIESLFRQFVTEAPRRFLGVIRPGFRDSYKLVASHWKLGTVTFDFSCRRLSKSSDGIFFARTCRVTTDAALDVTSRDEQAFVFSFQPSSHGVGEIPEFYDRRGRALGEISWEVDPQGQPVSGDGLYRYPISYPDSGEAGRTGLGVYYSAPFKSDSSRHGLANQSEEVNSKLSDECDRRFVAIFRKHLLPSFGPSVLSLVCNSKNDDWKRAVQVLGYLVVEGAIPVVKRKRGSSRPPRRVGKQRTGFSGRYSGVPMRYAFVIPEANGELSHLLAAANWTSFPMLDPKTPPRVVSLLLSGKCEGWRSAFTSLTWNDVVSRLIRKPGGDFTVPSEKELSAEWNDPHTARVYLDVLEGLEANRLEKFEVWTKRRDEVRSQLLLPDLAGRLRPRPKLHSAVYVPLELPGIKIPPVLHRGPAKHSLFSRSGWQLAPLTFEAYLNEIRLETNAANRKPFWNWLRRDPNAIPKRLWGKLKTLPIWPDKTNRQVVFADLCRLNAPFFQRTMATAAAQPHPHVEKLIAVCPSIGKLRTTFNATEVDFWYKAALAALPSGRLGDRDRVRFREIEQTVVRLARIRSLRPIVKRLKERVVILAQDGCLRRPSVLHEATKLTARLELLPADLAESRDERLRLLFPANFNVSAAALVRAMKEDAHNAAAFNYRAIAYSELKRSRCRDLENIDAAPVFLFEGTPVAPSSVAFIGRDDYWGNWKNKLSTKNLTARVQGAYEDLGVLSTEPTVDQSREFFEWLSRQTQDVLEKHIPCILLHAQSQAFQSWWMHTAIPSIPVRQGNAIKLIRYSEATDCRQRAYIPDFPELVAAIESNRSSRIRVLIVEHPKIRQPIDNLLRRKGFLSLRQFASDPVISPVGQTDEITAQYEKVLNYLHSNLFRNRLHKQLSSFDVDHRFLRPDWQKRVVATKRLFVADSLQALYSVAGEPYRVPVKAGFDSVTGTLWIDRDNDCATGVYLAIADCLFVADAPRYVPSIVPALLTTRHLSFDSEISDASVDDDGNADEPADFGIAASFETHRRKALPSVPQPTPMSRTAPPRRSNPSNTESRTQQARPVVEIEEIHSRELKVLQYVWHCQACLGELPASTLAPALSYAEHSINRRGMVDVHHADQFHSGGARHGGNIVLLCKRHHALLGDSLTRMAITHELQKSSVAAILEFPNGDQKSLVHGVTITLSLLDHPDSAMMFFTNEHRDLWLSATDTNGQAETAAATNSVEA